MPIGLHRPLFSMFMAWSSDSFKANIDNAKVWISEKAPYPPPLPPGEGWGEGVSNEPLPAHPSILGRQPKLISLAAGFVRPPFFRPFARN